MRVPFSAYAISSLLFLIAQPGRSFSQPIVGDFRSNFIKGGISSCIEASKKSIAGNEEFLRRAGITDQTIDAYCRCHMESVADQVTPEEMNQLIGGALPPETKAKIEATAATCAPLLTGKERR